MEALLCANSMVLIKQSHIWGISWKKNIYIDIYIYTLRHGHIQRIFTSLLAPTPAEDQMKKNCVIGKSYTEGIYKSVVTESLI